MNLPVREKMPRLIETNSTKMRRGTNERPLVLRDKEVTMKLMANRKDRSLRG